MANNPKTTTIHTSEGTEREPLQQEVPYKYSHTATTTTTTHPNNTAPKDYLTIRTDMDTKITKL